ERRRKKIANLGEFRAQALELGTGESHRRFLIEGYFAFVAQTVARTTDGETLVVEQFPDTTDKQHFVVLVIPAVAATLDRFELRELLFPVAQNVGLDAAQFADLTDGEI